MQVSKVDFTAADAGREFTDSLVQTGFGIIGEHPIDQVLITTFYQEWQAFFDASSKREYMYHKETQDGFFPMETSELAFGATQLDIKEYFQYYPWGQCPHDLKQLTQQLYDELSGVAVTLLDWIEQYTPADIAAKFSEPLSSMIKDSQLTMLRILHYPPFTGKEEPGAVRAAAHTDLNMLTVLRAASADGLETQNLQGEWIPVKPDPGMLVINIADALQMCTEGYYKSNAHRVINPEGANLQKSRLSTPLFLHARENVRLNEQYTAREYLDKRLAELQVV